MHSADIEATIRDVLGRIDRDEHIEDSWVELKSTWIDPQKAARRIAAQANAGRGAPVVWMVGIDEKRGLVGCTAAPLHDWWAQVATCFDTVVPALHDLAVSVDGTTVVVLQFATDHAPYVIKLSGSAATKEVPWREATAVRSASREELLAILRPLRALPSVEIVSGHFEAKAVRPPEGAEFCRCSLQLDLVINPVSQDRLVIQFRHCSGVVWTSFGTSVALDKVKVHPHDPKSVFARRDRYQIALESNARVLVSADANTTNMDTLISQSVRAEVELSVADAAKPLLLTAVFELPREGSAPWRKNWDKRKKWVLAE
jgi:hypothetical protein